MTSAPLVRRGIEKRKDEQIRRDRKERFRPKTQIQIKQAKETQQNYEKQSPQTTRIAGLGNMVGFWPKCLAPEGMIWQTVTSPLKTR